MRFKAQIGGFKTTASGGAKLTIDVFDTTPAKDIAMLTLLAMAKKTATISIEEDEDGGNGGS
ncbi:MAG TPA: hypothetical protein PK391_07180 [Syntrophales bacterium]|jgi:hypothetical protein|nr:hypothetical protein [Syntrophales bacterium]